MTEPVVDASALVADLAELVQIPSVTGDERAALGWLARRAAELGLEAELVERASRGGRASAGELRALKGAGSAGPAGRGAP